MKKIIITILLVMSFLLNTVAFATAESTALSFEETMHYLNKVAYSNCVITEWGIFGKVTNEGEHVYFDLYVPQLKHAWFIEVSEEDGQYVAQMKDIERILGRIAQEVAIGDEPRE